ncbi:MAG: biopolymer transporter ExbD [Spirochaetes bacterium]|nr:biopolymer transporter ExbD [Spirochaetota bacterium]
MKWEFKSRFNVRSVMDMTPLIDLSFTLLIFFILTYHASQGRVTSIVVNLPSAVKSGTHNEGQLVVSVSEKNEIFVNDTKFEEKALLDEFRKRKETLQKDTNVLIRGDRNANYETIVKVMDLLNQAGIPKFTLATIKGK